MPMIHVYVPEATLSSDDKRNLIVDVTKAAEAAEGVAVADRTWVLIHEVPRENWGERGAPLGVGKSRPIIEISTPIGWVTLARKRAMVQRVAYAAAKAAGTNGVHYVIIQEVPDGGWGDQGTAITRDTYQLYAAPDLEVGELGGGGGAS